MRKWTLIDMISLYLCVLSTLLCMGFAQLQSCPTQETQVTTPDGSVYAVCQQTDYQGTTTNFITTVATLSDCAQACSKVSRCTKVVYDKTNFNCHLKGGSLNWAKDVRYTTLRFISKPVSGATVTACPYGEVNTTSSTGVVYAVCPNTDYEGDVLETIGGTVSAQACANACDKRSGCSKAVFQSAGSSCALKNSASSLRWTSKANSMTLRVVSKLSQGTRITSCPGGETAITTDNKASFAQCPFTDFQVPSIDILPNTASTTACANSCSLRKGCTQAMYDEPNKTCHIKGNLTAPNWAFDDRYMTLRMVNGTVAPTANNKGRWSNIIQFPIIPVAAYVVPAFPSAQRLLVFSSWGARAFSGPTGITQFADYNYVTGAVSQRQVSNTKHDMFCPGISSLADGRIVITGGENAEATSIYDPVSNQFTRAADMKIARGYQTSATLSNGKIFTIGGSFTGPLGGKVGEIYDATTNAWTLLPGTDPKPLLTTDREGVWRTDNHAWLFGWRDGWVFQAGPSKAMNWYSTNGQGSVTPAGTRTTVMDQMCGVNVMYDVGKIFSAGGSQDYTDSPGTAMAHIITITDPGKPGTVERVPDMNWARGFANAVVLPDGKVLITGGQLRSLVFTDIDSVLVPELFDPVTKTFTQLAPAAVPRNYHAVSILLADGTVFVGGGGMCPAAQGDDLAWCDRAKDHFDGEIFSPPYLFDANGNLAPRPDISRLSATSVAVGKTITVTMANANPVTFSLVRMGSATHSINSDQRRVPLTNVKQAGTQYTIVLPNDAGVLLPGYYYLFALSQSGVPSVSKTLQIKI